MKKVFFGLVVLTTWVACSATDSVVENTQELSNDTNTDQVVSINDSTTSIVVVLKSSNPYNGRFQFDSTSTGWRGELQTFQMVGDSMKIVEINTLQPKENWAEFNDFLNFLKIYTLPDQKDIDGYMDNPRGSRDNPFNVQIVVQTRRANGSMNKYVYSNPAIETKDYWQSSNIITFVSYLTTEFEISNPVVPQK